MVETAKKKFIPKELIQQGNIQLLFFCRWPNFNLSDFI